MNPFSFSNPDSSNTFSTAKHFDRFKRFRKIASKAERTYLMTAMIFTLLVMICLCFFMVSIRFDNKIRTREAEMALSLDAVTQRYNYTDQILAKKTEYLNYILTAETTLQKFCLEHTPRADWNEAINMFTAEGDNVEFYYYQGRRPVLTSRNAEGLALSDEQMQELTDTGWLYINQPGNVNTYRSVPFANGHLILICRNSDEDIYTDVRSAYELTQTISGGAIVIYDIRNGEVLSSTDTALVGKNFLTSPVLTDGEDISVLEIDPASSDIPAGKTATGTIPAAGGKISEKSIIVPQLSFFRAIGSANSSRYMSKMLNDNVCALVYHNIGYDLMDTIDDLILPGLFFILVSLILIFSARYGRTIRVLIRDRSELLHLYRDFYFDKLLVKRIASIFLICVFLLIIVSAYITVLNDLSSENIYASAHLEQLNKEERYGNEQAALIEDFLNENVYYTYGKVIRLIESSDDMKSDEMLSGINALLGADDITIFDATGTAVASSSGYTGYLINSTEENTESQDPMWQIMNGSVMSQMFPTEGIPGKYIYVSKIKPGGVVRIELTEKIFAEMMNNLKLDATLLEADLGDSDLIYYDNSSPQTLLFIKAGSHTIETIENQIAPDCLKNGHFEYQEIGDSTYYLNVREDSNRPDNFFISAHNMGAMIRSMNSVIWSLLAGYILLFILQILLFGICIAREDEISDINLVSLESEKVSGTELLDELDDEMIIQRAKAKLYLSAKEALEHNFAFFVRVVYFGCIAAFLLYLLMDLLSPNKNASLVRYLFHDNWEKGLNIFSFTTILMLVILLWIVTVFLVRLTRIVSDNTGPAGQTVGRLLVSFLRFAALVATVLIVLSQLGVNTGTILASAGLTSVVIGIGAQSTVSNILSGLFIIFEGNFRVGDIVLIDGWTGMIQEIGVRTTCIESYGYPEDFRNIRVINNSDFNNITNLSRHPSQAVILVPVAYEADIEFINRVFDANAAGFKQKLPEILETPINDGLVALMDSSKTMRFRVKCAESDRTYVERRFLQLVVELLENNGVYVPFNQLVLRTESELKLRVDNGKKEKAAGSEEAAAAGTSADTGKDGSIH